MRSKKEIEEAVKKLRMLNADDEVRELAEAQERAELDRNTELYIAKEDGRAQGIAAGKIEGKEIGKKEEKMLIAKNLLKQGIDIEIIKKATELSEQELLDLKNQSN